MWVCLTQEMVPAGEMTEEAFNCKGGGVKSGSEDFWQSQSVVMVVASCSRRYISYKDLGDISVYFLGRQGFLPP